MVEDIAAKKISEKQRRHHKRNVTGLVQVWLVRKRKEVERNMMDDAQLKRFRDRNSRRY